MDEAALHAALNQLAEADILLVQGVPPDSEYRFKHALIQDCKTLLHNDFTVWKFSYSRNGFAPRFQ
jgi:hypothetical protein